MKTINNNNANNASIGLKSSKTAPSLPTLTEEIPKRKPKTYVKDRVKSRTKELMESIFSPLTRKASEKHIRKTESQRTGLAIVAPSTNSTTDPIIIGGGGRMKGSTSSNNWLSTAFGGGGGGSSASEHQKSLLRKTASQTTAYNTCSQGNSEKSFKRRSMLIDENGRLRLPFGDRSNRPKSLAEASAPPSAPPSSKSSIISSFRLTGRVMETVKNGPFSNNKQQKKENTEPPQPVATTEPKRSRSKLTLSLLSPLPNSSLPEKTSSEKRPLTTTPTSPKSPIVSITAPTPPAVKKHTTMAEILSSISPPPVSLLQPPTLRKKSFRASNPRLAIPECQTTSTNEYTTAEEGGFLTAEENNKEESTAAEKNLEQKPKESTAAEKNLEQKPSFKKKPGVEQGSLADIVKRRPKRYVHSHTTSAYDPAVNETAPDATERRRLIGFLHRTSHLSLTSELSADGHRRRQFEDSTVVTESDARVFSDDESRVSTSTDNITSVSRQHNNYRIRQRRMRRHPRQKSLASSMSSLTEDMSLEVMTVTLNMDNVNFLGISIVGQSSNNGDNGIYVANIMKGGAVALDGRIQAGDMILQVNDISFENFTNDQAVEVLKEQVSRRGSIKLTVAKAWDSARQDFFSVPSREPVRPIDMRAWIQHTNASTNLQNIPEGSEGAPTPVPGQYPHNYGRAPSSSTATSNGSGGQQTVYGPNGQIYILPKKLDVKTDKKRVVCVMALPNSGLDIKDRTWLKIPIPMSFLDRTWLKIPIPMSFLGSDLIDWLMDHIEGLTDRKEAKRYATDLLKDGYITHMVNGNKFNEQSYYMIGQECSDVVRMRQADENPRADALPPAPPAPWTASSAMVSVQQQQQQQQRHLLPPSSTPNSARRGISPNINSSTSSSAQQQQQQRPQPPPGVGTTGVFPTTFTADNSIYGIVGPGGISVPAPPPTWRLTEDTLASLRHVPMGDI
uniref:Segment polarity protein dishevelled n=1 Tax=Panagrolaimus sp. PS1159 TaxID=55785 RepID=A0AC35FSS1_9BILA